MGKSLFWKGVFYGALAGGALSMLDKDTRKAALLTCKKTTNSAAFYLKHPQEAVNQVKEVTNKVRTTVEQVNSDVSFIVDKVEELREGTPEVFSLLKDTKEAFIEDDHDLNQQASLRKELDA